MNSRFSQDPPLFDLDYYKSHPGPNRQNPLTQTDLRNAIALMEHLLCCHRAALEIPGISSALVKHPFVSQIDGAIEEAGIHCDHAYEFVEALLHVGQRWCAEQIDESPGKESPQADTPQLAGDKIKRLRPTGQKR